MRLSSKITVEQRARLVELFKAGYGCESAARIVGCGKKSSRNLWDRWRIHGSLAFVEKVSKSVYPFEVKCVAVQRFLDGESKPAIAKDLGLSSPKVLDVWVRTYRDKGEDGLRPKPKGRPKKDPDEPGRAVSEIDGLKRRVKYLEAENAYLKALRDLMNNEH